MSKSVSTINRPYLKIIKVKQEPDQNQDGSEEPKLEEFLKNEDFSNAYQIFCEMCDLTMLKTNVWRHLRTNKHKRNAGEIENVENSVKLESDENSEKYENCEICNKRLTKSYLQEHIQRAHETFKGKSVDFIEDKKIWECEFFSKMNKRQLETYKYNWGSFCKMSYHNQNDPPTEDMYADYMRKKIGKSPF